jgi:glycosyltransferase involved in cell wall biosynthesis
MTTIGAALIVKNEEAVLDKCLASLKGIDKIVVIDTGSTDRTVEIAKKYTPYVIENEFVWNDSFADARNFAKSKIDTDWILSIDADEELQPNGLKAIREAIKTAKQAVSVTLTSSSQSFKFPRVFKNSPNIFWKGAIHNYLNILPDVDSEAKIHFAYSPAHKNDPNRALRILQNEVAKGAGPREIFYLAREYMYRKQWEAAILWYDVYLRKAHFASEMAEAALQCAKAYWQLGNLKKAQESTLEALRINANFKEAMLFMSDITGPKNSAYWRKAAELCNNNDVLFVRSNEKKQEYYNNLYSTQNDFSRYEAIYSKVGKLANGKTLDIGCGQAVLKDYIKDYHGFDFSKKAIEKANTPRVWVGDLYSEDLQGYDTYVMLEVLEHIEGDIQLLERLPKGKSVIFSVPSFADPSHLRTYDESTIRGRYGNLVDIQGIIRFNWTLKWYEDGTPTNSYILLVSGKVI